MATAAELAILLKLHDEFSGKLKQPTKEVEGFGTSLKNVQAIAGGFLAASAVQKGLGLLEKGFKSSLQAANDQAQAERQLNAVIKSTGGAAGVTAQQADDLSQHFQNVTRIQDEVILSAENMLLTFTNIKSNIFPETTQAVLDMATAMKGGGIPSAEELKETSIQLGKALNDPVKGATALQRVGVALTATQKQQIETMVKQGNVLGAQKIILKEVESEFGGAAEAMTPFERNMDKAKDTIEGAKESIGFFIMGGLNILSQWLSDHGGDIIAFAEKFEPAFAFIEEHVGTHIAGVIGFIKSGIHIIEDIGDLVSDLAHGKWEEAWHDVEQVGLDIVAQMINGMAALFGQLPNLAIAAINEVIKAWDSVQGKLQGKLNIPGLGNVNPLAGQDLSIGQIAPVQLPKLDTAGILDAFKKVEDSGKDLSKASKGTATDIPYLGKAAKDTAGKLESAINSALGDIRSAASALFSQPTREFATLDLAIAQDVRSHMSIRPAIQDAIDSYTADADAHNKAAQDIEDSASRMAALVDAQIEQAQNSLKILQDSFAKEQDVRDRANTLAKRTQEDQSQAQSDLIDSLKQKQKSQIDSLNDQKDAIVDGPDAKSQKDAIDKQIKSLNDAYDAQVQSAQNGAKALDRANQQMTRANEDADLLRQKAQKKKEDDAQADIAFQTAKKKKIEDDAKKAADAERAAAGKAKDDAEAEKRKLEAFDKEEAAMKLRLDTLNQDHEIMKKRLVLADQTLLTEGGLKQKVDDLIPVTADMTTKLQAAAQALGYDLAGGVAALIVQLNRLKDLPDALLASLTGGNGIPSHAGGLAEVPYDNYLMLAHKKERVLTADEARAYNNQHNDNSKRTHIYGNVIQNFGGGNGSDMALASLA